MLELNIGTPYASQAAKGAVSTELDPARVTEIVASVSKAIAIPLWVKITGQSERVPELAHAAFQAGADAVVMAGRLLGLYSGPRHVRAHARHHARRRRRLEPASDLSLARAFTRARWSGQAAHRHERGAVRVGRLARMMLAGASAVEMSSAPMLRGFAVLSEALSTFAQYLREKNMSAADLIGRAADSRKTFAAMPLRQDNWRNYVPPEAKAPVIPQR